MLSALVDRLFGDSKCKGKPKSNCGIAIFAVKNLILWWGDVEIVNKMY